MKKHFALTKAQAQADWLARFADRVITLDVKHAGKIDWNSAKNFYFNGASVEDAAQQYVKNREV